MATYKQLRSTTISGQAGTTWYVQLWKKDYLGSSSEMTLSGEGFSVNWSGQGGTRDKQFLNSECVLNMYAQNSTDEDLIYDIFSKGDRNYYIRIYKNGESNADIWWFGWVNPSFSKIENVSFPYRVNIKATDSIGTFSKRKEDTIDNLNWVSIPRINSHIKDFGEAMGLYNSETELVTEGNFPDPSPDWDIQPTWTIPSGGGQIDYDGTSTKYIRQNLNSSVVAGSDYTISFTISNLADGESAQLSLKNYNGQHFFNSNTLTYTSNGNYQVSGTSLYNSSGFRITGYVGDSFSLTDVSVIEGLISNPSPCPTNNDWFQTSVDWWREGDTYQSDDPFYKYRATKTAFREEPIERPTKYKEYDVLKGVLQTFNTVGVLSEGKYNFIQPNSWRNNTSGILPFYKYIDGDLRNTSSESINNLLRVNGTEATILGGSTITFEPPLKEVTAEFKNTLDVVSIPTDQSATTELQLGYLDSAAGALDFQLMAVHTNKMLATDVETELGVDSNGHPYQFKNCFITSNTNAKIKLTDGSSTYYLTGIAILSEGLSTEWTESDSNIFIESGWGAYTSELAYPSINYPDTTNPCSISKVGNYYETIVSYMRSFYTNDAAPISGDLSITLTTTIEYRKVSSFFGSNISGANTWLPFTNPTTTNKSDVLNSSSYIRASVNEEANNVGGVLYTAYQNDNISEESLDLGSITIGAKTEDSVSTFANSLSQFNVAYSDAGNVVRFTSEGFTRGNGSVYSNITQLLANEFLQLQVEPLEILQADIYSSNISASKLLKYSINSDGSYNYYTFLGGKFSAQSETMSGEWYKVSSSTSSIIEESQARFNIAQNLNQTQISLRNFKSETTKGLIEDSLGVLSVAISSGVATTSITLGSSLKGDIAQNQNLKLTMPNGDKAKTIVVLTGKNSSANSFNTDSFTTDIDYPIGSIISISPYETVGLMQSLVSSGNVNFRASGSDNIQEMNFLPHDFNLTSNPSVGVASSDLGGSIQIASATANMYAQKLISKGKTITKVNIFGSANFAFRVYVGFIFNDTTTLVGSGTANTELDITDIVGTSRNYITIQIDVGSASEKVYGGYALVTNT